MSERRRMALEDLAWIFTEYRLNCRVYGLSQAIGWSHGILMYPTFAETMDRNCLDLYERQAHVRRIA
jgi:hypothetical protein